MSYSTLTGDPKKGAVPPGEYNVLESLMGEWEAITGYRVEPNNVQLLAMANAGVLTLADFGRFMATQPSGAEINAAMPWAQYGLTKDQYEAQSSTYATEYLKITGQDITPEALQKAFASNTLDPTGGLLSASQYAQQLMSSAAIQKQFGWVKYGLDFSQWQQQKLQFHTAFGRDINDAEAATILQYTHASQGSNFSAIGRGGGGQGGGAAQGQGAGIAGSVVR